MNFRKNILAVFCCTHLFFAQKKFSMNDAVLGLYQNFRVENLYLPTWIKNSNQLLYYKKGEYFLYNAENKKNELFLSVEKFNANASKKINHLPIITFENLENGYFNQKNEYFKISKKNNQWEITPWATLDPKAENVEIVPEKNLFLYTIDQNLVLQNLDKKIHITQEKNPHIISGKSVHRQEFGIEKGIFISPNAQKIAFYQMNETMVSDYPIIQWNTTPAQNKNIKYPMAGGVSHQVKLGIFDIEKNKKIFIQPKGDKEQYLTSISWTPDSKFVFIGLLNREQNHLKMNLYNAENGNFVKTIFEEKSNQYVEPQKPIVFLPNEEKDFIWQSQRDGYNHLYHYHIDKGFIRQITKGAWIVNEVLGFQPENQEIIFTSTKDSPLERNIYKIKWNGASLQKLNQENGIHNPTLSHNGKYIFSSFNNQETPNKVEIISTKNFKEKEILLNAPNPLLGYDLAEVKNITLQAEDKTPLYGKLMLPKNFDKNKKYPVIVYLYNGPHLQLITNSFPASGDLWYDYLTQNGYIVFSMDGRGSSNRGLAFEQATYQNLGEVEMKDQLKGVEFLKTLPYADTEKMGVFGWSFGGFMTTSLMLKYPNVFKVGVAGGPVTDWKMYEIMYTERYMSHPEKNPNGYKKTNLNEQVAQLKGKLMLIHGTEDDVVLWQHSINFMKEAMKQGVQVDYSIYPGHQHNVAGKDRVHLMQRITDYFNLYLKK